MRLTALPLTPERVWQAIRVTPAPRTARRPAQHWPPALSVTREACGWAHRPPPAGQILGATRGYQPEPLWQQQGKRAEVYELLAPIYGWCTEGFDTADLQDAKVLLVELM